VLFRLACLGVANAFALLRLLPMSDRDKGAEILAVRHQIVVLRRQLHGGQVRFTAADRAVLAALLHRLPRQVLHRLRLLVHPDTVLRWHRDLIRRRHAAISRPKRAGRPSTVRSIRTLVLRLARENSSWGYRRVRREALIDRVGWETFVGVLSWQGVEAGGSLIREVPDEGTQRWLAAARSSSGADVVIRRRRGARDGRAHGYETWAWPLVVPLLGDDDVRRTGAVRRGGYASRRDAEDARNELLEQWRTYPLPNRRISAGPRATAWYMDPEEEPALTALAEMNRPGLSGDSIEWEG
jgi:hypothetical protein